MNPQIECGGNLETQAHNASAIRLSVVSALRSDPGASFPYHLPLPHALWNLGEAEKPTFIGARQRTHAHARDRARAHTHLLTRSHMYTQAHARAHTRTQTHPRTH